MKVKEHEIKVLTFIGDAPDSKGVASYRWKDLVIIKSKDNTPKWGELLHISVSHRERHPTWEELLALKEYFFGDEDTMMVMPKKECYVNVHTHCFHIWKTPESWDLL